MLFISFIEYSSNLFKMILIAFLILFLLQVPLYGADTTDVNFIYHIEKRYDDIKYDQGILSSYDMKIAQYNYEKQEFSIEIYNVQNSKIVINSTLEHIENIELQVKFYPDSLGLLVVNAVEVFEKLENFEVDNYSSLCLDNSKNLEESLSDFLWIEFYNLYPIILDLNESLEISHFYNCHAVPVRYQVEQSRKNENSQSVLLTPKPDDLNNCFDFFYKDQISRNSDYYTRSQNSWGKIYDDFPEKKKKLTSRSGFIKSMVEYDEKQKTSVNQAMMDYYDYRLTHLSDENIEIYMEFDDSAAFPTYVSVRNQGFSKARLLSREPMFTISEYTLIR